MNSHVVMFSGGVGSWMAAKRAAENGRVTLLFADTLIEDEDLYRFLNEAAASVDGDLVVITEGRDPWEVFRDVRFLGNSRVDPCSRILKRELIRKYVEANYEPQNTTLYVGIDWSEIHRLDAIVNHWKPWRMEAPMCEPPYLSKEDMIHALRAEGIEPPRLYQMGFPHNNCGGFCIKAGQAHFRLLLEQMPDRYRYHEEKEQELREYLGADVAILRDRRGGDVRPITLREFRERIESGQQCDMFEWGGCGCFVDVE